MSKISIKKIGITKPETDAVVNAANTGLWEGGGATDPVNMVSELLSECKERGFDSKAGDVAYCVLDSEFDANKNNQLALAEKKAVKNNLSFEMTCEEHGNA